MKIKIYFFLIFAVLFSFFLSFLLLKIFLNSGKKEILKNKVNDRIIKKEMKPQLGGVGVFISYLITIYLFVFVDFLLEEKIFGRFFFDSNGTFFLYSGALFLIFILGFVDDLIYLKSFTKLLIEILIALIFYHIGFKIEYIYVPMGVGIISLKIFSLPFTVLWIVSIINAINLMDGLDGLAGGIVGISSFTIIVVLLLESQSGYALLLAPLLGGMAGFLPYNFFPAKIFLGDSGSLFAGAILSTILIHTKQKASAGITLMIPLIILSLPILDITLAFLRRIIKGRSPFSSDTDHIHHRFLKKGHNEVKTVRILLFLSLFFSFFAIILHLTSQKIRSFLLIIPTLFILGLLQYLKYISVREKKSH